jgi:hypothetical protein
LSEAGGAGRPVDRGRFLGGDLARKAGLPRRTYYLRLALEVGETGRRAGEEIAWDLFRRIPGPRGSGT